MKLFKGEMSLWAQLNDVKKLNGPGWIADTSTHRGTITSLVLGVFSYFVFWNMDAMSTNFSEWLKHPLSWLITDPEQILTPDMRKPHLYAEAWLCVFLFAAVLNFFNVWSTRRRARKSAKGQWYDNPGLSKEDLSGKPRQRREDDAS